ncbi:BEN domain-containing protein 5-like [Dermacentor albipictus]|uniref:BEN domain-containing protein 5-like n=1 Tax=Dermacentor albipictus TaxID=60249 RepID=UPI0031FD10E5
MRLQEKMLMMLDNKGYCGAPRHKNSFDDSVVEETQANESLERTEQSTPPLPPPASCARKENNMVDIGRGLAINAQACSHIQGHQKDSLFVKDLLLGIWPKDQLKNRSLQGKRCPRYPDRPAKAPLTPSKVEVMRDCYRQRLRRQGVPEHLLPAALKQLNHFVVEKLADLERLAKRGKDNHDPQASHE